MLCNVVCLCIQGYGDALRTDAIPVSIIVPYLLYGYACFFRCVRIDQKRHVIRCLTRKRLVAVQAFLTFLPEILDFCTVFILWKIIYGLLPAAIRTGCQCVSVNRSYEAIDALFQNNGDALRTLLILIVVITPSLLNCSLGLFRGVRIRQLRDKGFLAVLLSCFHRISWQLRLLCPVVRISCTIFELQKIGFRILPVVCFI